MSVDTSMTTEQACCTLKRLNEQFIAIRKKHPHIPENVLRRHLYIKTEKGRANEKILSLEFKESITVDINNFSFLKWVKNIFNRTFRKKQYVLQQDSLTAKQLKSLQQALQKAPQEAVTHEVCNAAEGVNFILEYVRRAKIADCHGNEKKEKAINDLFHSFVLKIPESERVRPNAVSHDVGLDVLPPDGLPQREPAETGQVPQGSILDDRVSDTTVSEELAQDQIEQVSAEHAELQIAKPQVAAASDASPVALDAVGGMHSLEPAKLEPAKEVTAKPEITQKQVSHDEICQNVYYENEKVFNELGISLDLVRSANIDVLTQIIKEKVVPELTTFAAIDARRIGLWGTEKTEYGVSGSLLRGAYVHVYSELKELTQDPKDTFQQDPESWLQNIDRLAKLCFYEKQMLRAYQSQDAKAKEVVYALMVEELARKAESYLQFIKQEDRAFIDTLYDAVDLQNRDSFHSTQAYEKSGIYHTDFSLVCLKKQICSRVWEKGIETAWTEKIDQPSFAALPLKELFRELDAYRKTIEPSILHSDQIQAIAMMPAVAYKNLPDQAQAIRNEVFQAAKTAAMPQDRVGAAKRKADEFTNPRYQPQELLDCIKQMAIIESLDLSSFEKILQEIVDKTWNNFDGQIYLRNRYRDLHSEIDRLAKGKWLTQAEQARCHVFLDAGKWQELKEIYFTALLEQKLGVSRYVAKCMYDQLTEQHDLAVWARAIEAAQSAQKGHAYKAFSEVIK